MPLPPAEAKRLDDAALQVRLDCMILQTELAHPGDHAALKNRYADYNAAKNQFHDDLKAVLEEVEDDVVDAVQEQYADILFRRLAPPPATDPTLP